MFDTLRNCFTAFRPFRCYDDAVRVYRTGLGIDDRPTNWNPKDHMTLDEAKDVMKEKDNLELGPAWVLAVKKRANEHALSSQSLSKVERDALENGLDSIKVASGRFRKLRISLLKLPPFN